MKRPNKNVTIRYNLSVNERYGAYFYGFESATAVENVKIYNNTHYFKGSISPEIMVRDRTPRATIFSNNIFFAAGSGTERGSGRRSRPTMPFPNPTPSRRSWQRSQRGPG